MSVGAATYVVGVEMSVESSDGDRSGAESGAVWGRDASGSMTTTPATNASRTLSFVLMHSSYSSLSDHVNDIDLSRMVISLHS